MLLLKMAFRNIFRQKRRTFFTALTMIGGFALACISIGWADGSYNNIIDMFTRGWLGHIQIHYKDYLDSPSIYKTIDNYDEIGKKLMKIKGVTNWTARVFSAGLASFKDKTSGVQIIGIDPEREDKTTGFHKKIIKGGYFKKGIKNRILIGKGLAKIIKAKIGDKIILVSQGADGSMANDIFTVSGIVSTDDDFFDRTSFYMKLDDAREFLVLGNKVHEIAITVDKLKDVGKIDEKISLALKNSDLSVAPWQEFAKDFYKAMKADKGGMWISLFVIILVVAVGVLNTILMSVFERIREYGVLKALGTRPSDIILLVLYEANIIAIFSIFIGAIIGFAVNYYLSLHGIRLSQSFTYGGMKFSEMMAEINLRSFIIPGITVLLTTIIVGFFPALKAAKTDPAKSLRFH
jgi:ABC-type lipoprotein release transport system permease subunit